MRSKLIGGALIALGLMVLLVTQLVLRGFSGVGWWVGGVVILLGSVLLSDG